MPAYELRITAEIAAAPDDAPTVVAFRAEAPLETGTEEALAWTHLHRHLAAFPQLAGWSRAELYREAWPGGWTRRVLLTREVPTTDLVSGAAAALAVQARRLAAVAQEVPGALPDGRDPLRLEEAGWTVAQLAETADHLTSTTAALAHALDPAAPATGPAAREGAGGSAVRPLPSEAQARRAARAATALAQAGEALESAARALAAAADHLPTRDPERADH
ncbi:hypothetical protein [Actinomadura kijaniata]|uniref:hypothetical protein n=1 Tax=Actinomadura kijaniata TaxID=46161 RepID=UPI0008328D3E|nr:hypothetical protein [Actinomadura kijaniata]